jgi:hypothetical protein
VCEVQELCFVSRHKVYLPSSVTYLILWHHTLNSHNCVCVCFIVNSRESIELDGIIHLMADIEYCEQKNVFISQFSDSKKLNFFTLFRFLEFILWNCMS